MRIHVLNDLHVEFEAFEPAGVDADVVVLAGDIHVGRKGVDWARTRFPSTPVVYVPGNHEYYGESIPKHTDALRASAKGTNVHVLDDDALIVGGVRFLGCTLWTDFALFGDAAIGCGYAAERMNDFRKIRRSATYSRLRPIDTTGFHARSVQWLKHQFDAGFDGPTMVVTHHAPSARSVPDEYRDDLLSAAYASHLDALVATSQAALWVHGHIHARNDYTIGDTRVLSNPRGYPREATGFVRDLVVEV